eukprot:gene9821-10863_t
MSVSFYFRLPDEVIEEILWTYLRIRDIARLDSATTNWKDRKTLISILAEPEIVIPDVGKLSYHHLNYLSQRQVKIDQLLIGEDNWVGFENKIKSLSLKTVIAPLRVMSIDACCGILTSEVQHLLSQYVANQSHPVPLKEIHLKNFKKMENECLDALLHSTPKLEVLDLAGCWKVADSLLTTVEGIATYLHSLDLTACFGVSQKGLLQFFERVSSLRVFKIAYSTVMNDFLVNTLAKNNPKLRDVDISACVLVSDLAVEHLVLHCEYLESIDVSQVKEITDNCLMTVRSMPKSQRDRLRHLNVHHCHKLTKEAILKTMQALPELEIIKSVYI